MLTSFINNNEGVCPVQITSGLDTTHIASLAILPHLVNFTVIS
jgi:hypothetical protein